MSDSPIQIVGNNIVMPAGGTVDGVDVGTAVPAAQSAADAAQATASAAAPQTRTLTAGTGLTGGGTLAADRSFACDFGTAAGKVCEGNDPRVVNAIRFCECWGNVAAAAVAAGRFFGRTNTNLGTNTTAAFGEVPFPATGTFVFTLTARVAGTKLATNSVALEIYKNGVATGITLTLLSTDTVKQASGSLAVTLGDGISVRALQSGTEAETNWNCGVAVTAVAA